MTTNNIAPAESNCGSNNFSIKYYRGDSMPMTRAARLAAFAKKILNFIPSIPRRIATIGFEDARFNLTPVVHLALLLIPLTASAHGISDADVNTRHIGARYIRRNGATLNRHFRDSNGVQECGIFRVFATHVFC